MEWWEHWEGKKGDVGKEFIDSIQSKYIMRNAQRVRFVNLS